MDDSGQKDMAIKGFEKKDPMAGLNQLMQMMNQMNQMQDRRSQRYMTMYDEFSKSSKSFNFSIDVSNELIRSSYNFFSFITFFELALSCQKLDSSILELWSFNLI